MAVMLADVGSVIATLGFGAVLFLVVIGVCVLLMAIIAAVLPTPASGVTAGGSDSAVDDPG